MTIQSQGDSQGILRFRELWRWQENMGYFGATGMGRQKGLCLIYAGKKEGENVPPGGGGQLFQTNAMIPAELIFRSRNSSDDAGEPQDEGG